MEMDLTALLDQAVSARQGLLDEPHTAAVRLFNGFNEGCPGLVADLYARTLLLTSHAAPAEGRQRVLEKAQAALTERLPWLSCVVQKLRRDTRLDGRRGRVTFGSTPDGEVCENGVRYAVDLLLNQDASFYLDTRPLRAWLTRQAAGWSVLNTFAYTGSLGVAALAGGAARVVQVDLNPRFLALARRSATLNHLDWSRMQLQAADFFSEIARLKRSGELFDCVLADPPFFSTTSKGRVDLVGESTRLVNKLRPLVKDGGRLGLVNNALFLAGADYLSGLKALCAGGFLEIEDILPVPPDVAGFSVQLAYPANPAPFNHPTKMAILKVKKK